MNELTLSVSFAVVTVDERNLTMTSSSFESSSPMGVEAVTSTAAAAVVSSPTGAAAVIASSYSPKLPQLQTTFSAEDDQA